MNKNSNYEASACFNSTDGVKVKVAVMFIEKIPQINTMYRMLYFFNCRVRQTGPDSQTGPVSMSRFLVYLRRSQTIHYIRHFDSRLCSNFEAMATCAINKKLQTRRI